MIGEEMGLGKTVEVAALVLSHPAPPLMPEGIFTADGLLVSGFTPLLNCILTAAGLVSIVTLSKLEVGTLTGTDT